MGNRPFDFSFFLGGEGGDGRCKIFSLILFSSYKVVHDIELIEHDNLPF